MNNLLSEEENALDPMLTKLPIEITLENPNRNNIDTLFLYTQRVSSGISFDVSFRIVFSHPFFSCIAGIHIRKRIFESGVVGQI